MTKFNQFSENSCQNLNNFQTSNITLNPFRVQQTACSKTIIESVPIAHSISTFPPQALPSVEQNPESQLPHSHQFSSVLHPISNERFRHSSFETNSSPWTSKTAPYWQNPTSNHSIKLPPLTIQNFNGNPLKYHEWINNFFASYITTPVLHVIQAYSCDPAYYSTALNELMSYFGDPTIVVNAFINHLEN